MLRPAEAVWAAVGASAPTKAYAAVRRNYEKAQSVGHPATATRVETLRVLPSIGDDRNTVEQFSNAIWSIRQTSQGEADAHTVLRLPLCPDQVRVVFLGQA